MERGHTAIAGRFQHRLSVMAAHGPADLRGCVADMFQRLVAGLRIKTFARRYHDGIRALCGRRQYVRRQSPRT